MVDEAASGDGEQPRTELLLVPFEGPQTRRSAQPDLLRQIFGDACSVRLEVAQEERVERSIKDGDGFVVPGLCLSEDSRESGADHHRHKPLHSGLSARTPPVLTVAAPLVSSLYDSVSDESPESDESCEWLWSSDVLWVDASVELSDSVSLDSVSFDSVSLDSDPSDSVPSDSVPCELEGPWSPRATALTHSPWF